MLEPECRAEFVGREPRAVRRRTGLKAPALDEGTGIDDVITERVDQIGDHRLGFGVVTGDRQRTAVG
jgi:hypothetical protein